MPMETPTTWPGSMGASVLQWLKEYPWPLEVVSGLPRASVVPSEKNSEAGYPRVSGVSPGSLSTDIPMAVRSR